MNANDILTNKLQEANFDNLSELVTYIYKHINPYLDENNIGFKYDMDTYCCKDVNSDCIGCMATACVLGITQQSPYEYVVFKSQNHYNIYDNNNPSLISYDVLYFFERAVNALRELHMPDFLHFAWELAYKIDNLILLKSIHTFKTNNRSTNTSDYFYDNNIPWIRTGEDLKSFYADNNHIKVIKWFEHIENL